MTNAKVDVCGSFRFVCTHFKVHIRYFDWYVSHIFTRFSFAMSPLKLSPAHSTGQPHNTQFTSFSFRLRAKCDIYRGFHTRYTRNWSDAQSLRRTVFADCYFSILCHRSASKYFDTFSEQQTQFTEFSRMPLLEVCVDSFESAEAAIRGGESIFLNSISRPRPSKTNNFTHNRCPPIGTVFGIE